MTVNLNAISLFHSNVTPTAPLIEGTAASSLSASGFDTTTSVTGRYGMRVTFPSALDFTSFDWVSFQLYSTQYGPADSVDTIANGGWRVVFVDGSGNYSGFNVYGSGVPNYSAANGGFQDGFFVSYVSTDNTWFINKARTPDISSGTVNWANITACEVTAKTTSAARKQATLNRVTKRTSISFTGTETLLSIRTAALNATTAINAARLVQRTPYYQFSASGVVYTSSLGLLVGNGSTTTNWTDSNFLLGFENTYDKSPTYRSTGPWIQLDNNNTRLLKVNQAAADTLALSDFSIASAAWWQWELTGSGTASCTRGQFWRFNSFKAGHGTYTDCTWDGGESAVEITAATTVTRGTVRNGVGHGIKLTGVAGNYSSLDVDFDSNSTYDIELGSGGAGTYNLAGIAVIGAYTLKIHNDSATNAVVVEIPSGITYSTSTAGGSITVSLPVEYQSVTLTNVVAGSRVQIYDTTNSTELLNSTTLRSWTDTVAASVSGTRDIRVRISKVDGATAYRFIEADIGTCEASGTGVAVAYRANQEADATYNFNVIDGSAVTGITFTDSAVDVININLSVPVDLPDIYAAWVYYASTEAGIATDIDYIEVIDPANYILSNLIIKNTTSPTKPLKLQGGYFWNALTLDPMDCIDTTGGTIFLAPPHVVSKVVTVSGVNVITGDIADVPTANENAAATLAAAQVTPIHSRVKWVNETELAGAGTPADPMRPAA